METKSWPANAAPTGGNAGELGKASNSAATGRVLSVRQRSRIQVTPKKDIFFSILKFRFAPKIVNRCIYLYHYKAKC